MKCSTKTSNILLVLGKNWTKNVLHAKSRIAHDPSYVLSNEPRFWFNALTNLYFTEYQMP